MNIFTGNIHSMTTCVTTHVFIAIVPFNNLHSSSIFSRNLLLSEQLKTLPQENS